VIECSFNLDDEDETWVGYSYMPHAPRVGESIWLQDLKANLMASWIVIRVAYWVPDNRTTSTTPRECTSCLVYVERDPSDLSQEPAPVRQPRGPANT
jgi:hypothetical protein